MRSVYLDYAGATPDKTKIKLSTFANPSAIFKDGLEAKKFIDDSREKIAKLINAHKDEIIFTGSGTESIALALNTKKQIITTNIEHLAVLENCNKVVLVEVEENGIVNPKKIREAITDKTEIVSVMYANNEIGTIQPIKEIAKEIRHYRKINNTKYPLFHTDACQAINYLEIDNIERLGVDLMSFNSSKIYGPKGVGVLYKKRGVDLSPLYRGGGQEFKLRSGTENVTGIIAVSQALEQVCSNKENESERLIKLRDYTIEKLEEFGCILNGDRKKRLPNNINITIPGISSELIVVELDALGIFVSEKSACSSRNEEVSHVLKAINRKEAIRISMGQNTTKKDMNRLISAIKKVLEKYKDML